MRRAALLAVGAAIVVAALAGPVPRAQMRVVPVDEEQGHVALGLALRHLANTGTFMQATAHPDDETNGLLVMLNRGLGYRTVLATATRGNGGQNEIGPEIFEALGVLRTQELAAMHRFDGAEQYFTRAVDFGYSFSIDETFEKWGREEILGDFVHVIRMVRPDVMLGMSPAGTGGGQHHQASAVLWRDAMKIAGDPTKYPDQIKEGLRPWQPRKFYFNLGGGNVDPSVKATRTNLALFDSLLGKTFIEMGTEARSMHKCQGMAQLLSLPGPAVAACQLTESAMPGRALQSDEASLFDGVDSTIVGLAQFAGSAPPKALVDGLAAISSAVADAQKKFDSENDRAALPPLLAGLHATRTLRQQLRDTMVGDAGRFEIDFRLDLKEREFQQAILTANGVRLEALADDGLVVPGQSVKLSVILASHGGAEVTVRQVKFDGFDGGDACTLTAVTAGGGRGGRGATPPPAPVVSVLKPDVVARCEPSLKIPQNARVTEPYWHRKGEAGRYTFDADAPFGLPFRPTPFRVQVTLDFPGGESVIETLPIQYRYEGNIFSGEKRSDLLVVPAFSVRVSPEIAIIPADSVRPGQAAATGTSPARRSERELRVTVVNDSPGAAENLVKLQLPAGWTASPAEQGVKFTRQDESQTVRFQLKPAPGAQPGEYHVRASISSSGQTFDRGYQTIEYPHIRRQHIYHDADVTLKIIDVKTAPNLTVGYIVGVGDEVPAAIEQLGVKLEYIAPEDLAWGNLSRFDTIVTGVRAYERRDDLRANNSRLLEYVRNGGTLIVQYNKTEFNEAQYGPYPAKVTQNRVTDEFAAPTLLVPGEPVFSFPNRITDAAWKNWVQERGLYFLGELDRNYQDLVQFTDPFPYNKDPHGGALVSATYGKGHWVYVGLGLWRQLPAGTDGAYQILANLISRGKAPAARSTTTSAAR